MKERNLYSWTLAHYLSAYGSGRYKKGRIIRIYDISLSPRLTSPDAARVKLSSTYRTLWWSRAHPSVRSCVPCNTFFTFHLLFSARPASLTNYSWKKIILGTTFYIHIGLSFSLYTPLMGFLFKNRATALPYGA